MDQMEKRKTEHIRLCLEEDVAGKKVTTGLENYRFRHQALPELDFGEVSLAGTSFLGKRLQAPLLVSSMTGGTQLASDINRRLAETAERYGWAMGLGSVRAAIERPETTYSFRIRDVAPTIPLFANLGAVQLNYGYGVDECRRAVELTEADGLVLHLNGMQELFQPGGNTNFSGILRAIEQVCRTLSVPVGVKEVGWGIDGETARRLSDAGAAFIDVAGAGGTSWSEVERLRLNDPMRRRAAEAFADWGVPTAECVREVRAALPHATIVASGGIASGVDAAKAIALGADVVGVGRALLAPSVSTDELQLDEAFARIAFELRATMFGIGVDKLERLKGTTALRRIDR